MTLLRSTALHMAVAFLAMGGWAAFANHRHPMPAPLLAGAVQGTVSALITFGLKRMLEAMARRLTGLRALILPPFAAALSSLLLLVTIHRLAGTPEIAGTVAVPLSVTTLYAGLYSLALWRRPHA